MSPIASALVMFLIVWLIWLQLQRNYIRGIAAGVLVCVCMSTFLRLDLPGALPELTIHRAILVEFVLFGLISGRLRSESGPIPLAGVMFAWAAVNFVSVLLTNIDFVSSLKRALDFVLEVMVFYFVAGRSIRSRTDAITVLRAAWLGLCVVALFAVIEKYTGFNPVDRFLSPREDGLYDVMSTYPHRILLGAGMAMGFPLAFSLMQEPGSSRLFSRGAMWFSAALFLSGCYFSMSRGPWLGAMVGGIAVFALGSRELKRKLAYIVVCGVIVMVVRPGVWESIAGLGSATADVDSLKGGTFRYRLELWKIAFHEVSTSPERFLFGFGPGAGSEMELNWDLSYRERSRQIESWDNHYAYDLFQTGMVGLAATAALYFATMRELLAAKRRAAGTTKDMLAGIIASIVVLLFMMTNVLVFAKQLGYLFWSLVAVGIALARQSDELHVVPEEVTVESESADSAHAPIDIS